MAGEKVGDFPGGEADGLANLVVGYASFCDPLPECNG